MAKAREDCLKDEAPAKLNLRLQVGPKLSSGYHELSSIICPLSLFDEVEITVLPGCDEHSIRCELSEELKEHVHYCSFNRPDITQITNGLSGEGNLALRAAKAFIERIPASMRTGVSIRLLKRIPFQAGLGGGSSDAAAVLRLLLRYFRSGAALGVNTLGVDTPEVNNLEDIALGVAADLGSDISALLHRRLLLMKGRGNDLYEVKGRNRPYIDSILLGYRVGLLKPPVGVATGEAYRRLNRPNAGKQAAVSSPSTGWESLGISAGEQARLGVYHPNNTLTFSGQTCSSEKPVTITHARDVLQSFSNDFETVVFATHPEVAEAARLLKAAGAEKVLLCGSGSAVAGFAESADARFADLKSLAPRGWLAATASLMP